MELPLIDLNGTPTQKHKPCNLMVGATSSPLTDEAEANLRRYTIPGLDASLCRCPPCRARSHQGIWWIDEFTRARVLQKWRGEKTDPPQGVGDATMKAAFTIRYSG